MGGTKIFAINSWLRVIENIFNAIFKLNKKKLMASTPSNEKEAILTFEDKKYDLKSLPKEVQELIKGMQVADAQLRMHEDTLKVLAVGRQHLAMQLKSKLESINPI